MENKNGKSTLRIYVAANAVMYLPVFVAKEMGILDTLIPDMDISIDTLSEGDEYAVKKMAEENVDSNSTNISMAIADPRAIKGFTDAKVIGVLIDKLAFWAVSKVEGDFSKTGIIASEEAAGNFQRIKYYNSRLATGYDIGKKIRDKGNFGAPNGDETNFNLTEKDVEDGAVAISADLLNIAKFANRKNEKVYKNYCFTFDNEYKHDGISNSRLMTAIIASGCQCNEGSEKEKKLIKVIEALQLAKAVIYSSKKIAEEILKDLDFMKNVSRKGNVAKYIIETIHNERFYPEDFNISEKQWKETIIDEELDFANCVDNHIVLQSERNMALRFGIDVHSTFGIEVGEIKKQPQTGDDAIKQENEQLKEKIGKLEKENKRLRQEKTPLWKRIADWFKKTWKRCIEWIKKHKLTTVVWTLIIIWSTICGVAYQCGCTWVVEKAWVKWTFTTLIPSFFTKRVDRRMQSEHDSNKNKEK